MRPLPVSLALTVLVGCGICQTLLDPTVVIDNVKVPLGGIVCDSISPDRYFYSGQVTFDVLSNADSVSLHVFLEEVPFQMYRIKERFERNTEQVFTGSAHFLEIDSLCTGDLGWVRPKVGCSVVWSYSTANRKNHCRIKIGTGNFLYVNTQKVTLKNGAPYYTNEYDYNNLGLVAQARVSSSDQGRVYASVNVPRYTRTGQLLVDDTTAPFAVNGYDAEGRAVFRREANQTIANFFYGYSYDSLGRAIEIRDLSSDATPENPGLAFNTERITYDRSDRVSYSITFLTAVGFVCPTPYSFSGTESWAYFYKDGNTKMLDSVVRDFRDTTRNDRLVSRIIESYDYVPDTLLASEIVAYEGYDDPGTCWSSSGNEERMTTFHYDTLKYLYRYDNSIRKPPSVIFVPSNPPNNCYRRGYDLHGNTITQFDFCDNDERILWTGEYDELNHLTKMHEASLQGDSLITSFRWDLIDLDKQGAFLHE